jgi:hypothetical protein
MGKARLLRSCEGKVAYASRKVAFAVLQRMRRAKHARVDLYRCKGCGCWHIGGQLKW